MEFQITKERGSNPYRSNKLENYFLIRFGSSLLTDEKFASYSDANSFITVNKDKIRWNVDKRLSSYYIRPTLDSGEYASYHEAYQSILKKVDGFSTEEDAISNFFGNTIPDNEGYYQSGSDKACIYKLKEPEKCPWEIKFLIHGIPYGIDIIY